MENTDKKEQKTGYRDVFTQKEYCKIILANVISRFGDSVDAIAFTWLVYQVTGSAAWSAIIFSLNQLPTVLVQPFAGALVEGMNKKRLMVITDCMRGIIVAILAALYVMDCINPWILVVFTLVISTVEAFHIPAGMAIIPKLIKPEYYSYGTSLNNTICTVIQLIGAGLAGFIIGLFGIHVAILIDAITFFGSAFILAFINVTEEIKKTKFDAKEYFDTLKGGAVYLKDHVVIRNFCFMAIVLNAFIVPLNSLQSPIISEIMGQGSELLSVFGIALSLGMGLGSFVFPYINDKVAARTNIILSGISMGICIYLFTLGTYLQQNVIAIYALTVLASLLLGFAVSCISGVLNVNFVKHVEQDYLARVGAIFNAGSCAAIPVTSVLVSIFVSYFSTAQILVVSAVLCVILFIIIGFRKVRFE